MKKEDMQKILNHKYKTYEECLYVQKRYFKKNLNKYKSIMLKFEKIN